MKIVVVGGTGMVGRAVVAALRDRGHEVVAAAPETGVNTITGEGVDDAFTRADAVLDVTNSPDMTEEAAIEFFRTSTGTQLAAERTAGVRHHVTLSIVGVDRPHELGYYRAKFAQEQTVRAGDVPYTIVRATQFFEFIMALVDYSTDGGVVRVPTTMVQPIAVADLADALAEIVTGPPANGTVEIAGPSAAPLDDLARRLIALIGDDRTVVTDPRARPFLGVELSERLLLPGPQARHAPTRLEDWAAAAA